MKDFREITTIIATATGLPAFIMEANKLELVRTGFLNRRLLSFIDLMISENNSREHVQRANAAYPKLLRYVDRYNLSYLILVLTYDPLQTSIMGPFFLEEKDDETLIECLCSLPEDAFTRETAQRAVDTIDVKDSAFIQAWGQLVMACYGWPSQPYVKINTIKEDRSSRKAAPDLSDNRAKEAEISTSYRFEREMKQLVMQGNKEKLRKLLVPKNPQELELAKMNSVYFTRRNTSSFRGIKNLLISMNTIFRQAAENSGLTPVYLHTISEDIVYRIERSQSDESNLKVIDLMIENYCNAINNVSMQNHSVNIVKVQRYIINHIDERLSLEKLSEVASLDRSYLCRLFKRECHKTITEYIQTQRINEAKWILESSNRPLMEIAQILGYQDQSYFCSVFKKYTGMTPSTYRRNYGNYYSSAASEHA